MSLDDEARALAEHLADHADSRGRILLDAAECLSPLRFITRWTIRHLAYDWFEGAQRLRERARQDEP